MSWQDDAACRGATRVMYGPLQEPSKHLPARIAKALSMCAECPVIIQCREAGQDEIHGVWGGVDKTVRRVHGGVRWDGGGPRPIVHGTASGYRRHVKRGEVPCDECRAARAEEARNERLRRIVSLSLRAEHNERRTA